MILKCDCCDKITCYLTVRDEEDVLSVVCPDCKEPQGREQRDERIKKEADRIRHNEMLDIHDWNM